MDYEKEREIDIHEKEREGDKHEREREKYEKDAVDGT